jgi:hypothetical protein
MCETHYSGKFVIPDPTTCRRWIVQLFSHWSYFGAVKISKMCSGSIKFEFSKFWKIHRHHLVQNEITVILSYSSRKTVNPTNWETFLKKIPFLRRYQLPACTAERPSNSMSDRYLQSWQRSDIRISIHLRGTALLKLQGSRIPCWDSRLQLLAINNSCAQLNNTN